MRTILFVQKISLYRLSQRLAEREFSWVESILLPVKKYLYNIQQLTENMLLLKMSYFQSDSTLVGFKGLKKGPLWTSSCGRAAGTL